MRAEAIAVPRVQPGRRAITYPTNHVLGILPDPATAERVAHSLVAGGVAPADVSQLAGPDDADRMDGLGQRHGLTTRILRIVQFVTMDQAPDFARYETAIRDGRAVLAVHVTDRRSVLAARDAIAAAGGYFLNFYGRVSTEELDRNRDGLPPS
jgi:hypothetical protein